MAPRYYGKRFYRVVVTLKGTGEYEERCFDDRRSEALCYARNQAMSGCAVCVELETIDDRYPATVLEREAVEVA